MAPKVLAILYFSLFIYFGLYFVYLPPENPFLANHRTPVISIWYRFHRGLDKLF